MKRILVLTSMLAILASAFAFSAGSARAFTVPLNGGTPTNGMHVLRIVPGAPTHFFSAATTGYVQVLRTTTGKVVNIQVKGLSHEYYYDVFFNKVDVGGLTFKDGVHTFSGTFTMPSLGGPTPIMTPIQLGFHVYIKVGGTTIGAINLLYTPDLIR